MKYFLKLKNYGFLIALVIIEILLFIANYVPDTYLIGWDNLMPEFYLLLNFKRSLFGIWQDYRGLGLVDGLSHLADFMHIVYVSLIYLVLPQSLVRYVFIFLTHLVGGIGFYYLARHLNKDTKSSFIGALFYMFNLGIIQMYFAPLEVFAIHFAALPFLALFIDKTLKAPTKKNILILFTAAFLSTPQAFVPTVFIAFSILLTFFLIFHYFSTKKLKTILLIFIIFFSVNAFWLLPYIYGAKNNANVILNTRINQYSSEEIFSRNKAFGGINQVLGLKGFLMETLEYDAKTNKNVFFLDVWKKYENTLVYKSIYITCALLSLIGFIEIIRRKKRNYFPYVASFLIAFFFLANNTPVIEEINTLLRNTFPIMGEILRFPFTKFITLFIFCFALFFSFSLSLIFSYIHKLKNVLAVIGAGLILVLGFPAFQGQFVSPLLKVNLPKDYLHIMDYLNTVDENQRIALLPAYSFWNWQYRNWGQRGSDFLWYGIKQPLLERPFDPWSLSNEQFYNELSYAINTENTGLFKNVIDKYDLSYFLLDEYFVNTLSSKPINYDRLHRFLSLSDDIFEEKLEFGKLRLYKIKNSNPWISSLDKNQTPEINEAFPFTGNDHVFNDLGNYVIYPNQSYINYPFNIISTDRTTLNSKDFHITQNNNNISFTSNNFKNIKLKKFNIEIPSALNSEYLIPVRFEMINNHIQLTIITPKILLNEQSINTVEEPILINPNIVSNPNTITFTDINHTIKPGEDSYIRSNYINTLKLKDNNFEELITIDTKRLKRSNMKIYVNTQGLNSITVEVKKIKSPLFFENIVSKKEYDIIFHSKEFDKQKSYSVNEQEAITFQTKNNTIELTSWKPLLFHQASYLVYLQTKYISGLPLIFYIDNPFEKRAEFETRISKSSIENFVILPKTQDFFEGYGLHLVNKSIGTTITKNVIKELSVYPIPLDIIKGIRITPVDITLEQNHVEKLPLLFQKENPFLYKVFFKNETNSLVVLSQKYHNGWKAYSVERNNWLEEIFPMVFGKEIKKHILVNNWANAWEVSIKPPKYIMLIFWPQYLEFIGFGILIITLALILIRKNKRTNT